MRDRLVAAFVGVTISMMALFGIPRAYLLADLVATEETRQVERSADLLAAVMAERTTAAAPVTSAFLEGLLDDGEGIEYVTPDDTVMRAGEPIVRAEGDIVQTRRLEGGGSLTTSRSGASVDQRVSDEVLPSIVAGLVLVALAAGLGVVLARRLARPFGELAGAADHLGKARFDLELPHYSIPEAEAIGAALRRASAQLNALVVREREFAANVSHQLRSPVTALRLTLEDLTMWPETTPAVAAELTGTISELDRLSGAITQILDLSRGRRLGDAVDVDLSQLVGEAVARWTPHFAAAGRELLHDPVDPVAAHTVPGPVAQILDVLLDNACAHGEGRVVAGARDLGKFLHVGVVDEGRRTVDNRVFNRGASSWDSQGHGLGLTIASELAVSVGGYLTLADAPTTTFVLVVPAPELDDLTPVRLRDGTGGFVVPLLPANREALREAYGRLSERTRYNRFLAAVPTLTDAMLDHLVSEVDGVNHVALVLMVTSPDGTELPLGLARMVRYRDDPNAADIAVTVLDEWHGRGVATALLEVLMQQRPSGVRRLVVLVGAKNRAALAMLRRLGEVEVSQHEPGVKLVVVTLPDTDDSTSPEDRPVDASILARQGSPLKQHRPDSPPLPTPDDPEGSSSRP